MNDQQEKPNKVGALWQREAKSGRTYYTGVLELPNGTKLDVVAFPQEHKKNPKGPDIVINIARPRENTHDNYRNDERQPRNVRSGAPEVGNEDIPF